MQFVADDKKNIKALVNTFFIGTEQAELLICLFELPSHWIYMKFARVWIMCS